MGSTFTNGAYLVLDRTVRVVRLLDQLIFELLARGFICVCLGLVMYRRSRVHEARGGKGMETER